MKQSNLEVVTWSIDKVKPYKNNPRNIPQSAVDKVSASLKEFGWRQPIVVDKAGVIIVGHTRYRAAQALEMESVPVHVAQNLTAKQIKAYRIADNRVGEEAQWDVDLLKIELEDLDTTDFSLDLLGFEEVETLQLLAGEGEYEAAPLSGESHYEHMTGEKGSLSTLFGVPPFSVLNARTGWWRDRKQAWLSLGIESEAGRG